MNSIQSENGNDFELYHQEEQNIKLYYYKIRDSSIKQWYSMYKYKYT